LNDAYENSKEVKILVSQPRRLAAIALAQRVSAERSGQHTVGDEVGFSIRMNNQTSKNTRLTFMTTGILLKILEASALDGVTHIIIDEVLTLSYQKLLLGLVQFRYMSALAKAISC